MFAGASISANGDGDFSNNTANLTGWVRAEHDIDLAAGAPSIDLGVGAYYEIPVHAAFARHVRCDEHPAHDHAALDRARGADRSTAPACRAAR